MHYQRNLLHIAEHQWDNTGIDKPVDEDMAHNSAKANETAVKDSCGQQTSPYRVTMTKGTSKKRTYLQLEHPTGVPSWTTDKAPEGA